MGNVVSLFLEEYFAGRNEDVDNQDEFKRIPGQKENLVSIICADDKKELKRMQTYDGENFYGMQ